MTKKRTPQQRAFSLAMRRKKPKINLMIARIFDGLAAIKAQTQEGFKLEDVEKDFQEWKKETVDKIKQKFEVEKCN